MTRLKRTKAQTDRLVERWIYVFLVVLLIAMIATNGFAER